MTTYVPRVPSPNDFPSDFVWGTATAAYQIEGATTADGRGVSIWDTFAKVPGAIADGRDGEPADEHYVRYAEDVALMTSLGVNAYRYSISWPRIQADGTGAANPKGLDFYRRLTEKVLESGLTPWVTLYHWDLPQALEDDGGWLNRDTADRFADYSALVVDHLHDLVDHWITLNEPKAAAWAGYDGGVHAPGKHLGGLAARAGHHLGLAHGRSLARIRELAPQASAGVTLDIWPMRPARDNAADRAAAHRADGPQNRFYVESILTGAYPQDALQFLGQADWFAEQPSTDLEEISQPIDFIGINYYGCHTVAAAEDGETPVFIDGGAPRTQMGWPIHTDGIIQALELVSAYQPALPVYVTENGSAWPDEVEADGEIRDADRTTYLQQHLGACADAIAKGVPLKGYFGWTLMDNFEWQFGYTRRFGLVHVDFESQRRTVKQSGKWLSSLLGGTAHE